MTFLTVCQATDSRAPTKMSRKLNVYALGILTVLLARVAVSSESYSSNDALSRSYGVGELPRSKRKALDPQTCADNFDIQRDKIIRTEESREMGAKYLNELDVGSRDECLRLCCETDTCDVFVFEEKSPGSCYMFNCGPPEDFKCKFTRHTNFSSAVLALSRHLAELQDQIRLVKHEQDLASLRKQTASTARPTTPAPTPPPPSHSPTAPPPTHRRCSPYQFECHGSGECIAIYNACDGIPQCSDGSDEAAELGCPQTLTPAPPRTSPPRAPPPPPPPPRELTPVDQLAAQKMTGAEAVMPFLRPAAEGPRWPHRLMQAQPPPLKSYADNSPSSHIFSHKGGLLQDGDGQAQPQYMPYEGVQETQWVRRPWEQSMPMGQMPMNDRQLMYHYGLDDGVWKPPAQLQPIGQLGQPETQQMQPLQPRGSSATGGIPDRDKMWAVPQAPIMKPEPPVYSPAKTMPEAPIMYSNQQGTLRDSPKKGFDLTPQKFHIEKQDTALPDKLEKESASQNKAEPNENTMTKEVTAADNKTKKKAESVFKQSDAKQGTIDEAAQNNKHEVKHDHYKMEDDHDGLSEKPPGAILLLTLGVLMTTIMMVMLGCRLRAARRRMRRAGRSPFAHDADYLVNGMYL